MTSTTRSEPVPRTYRHDIDGLRGVAIALVACYHVWAGRVSGGVDVFLTLSGFFLATTLLGRMERWSTADPVGPATLARELGATWVRIGRRLLPAAVVTLAGTLLASVVLLPQMRWRETAEQILASLLYFENWHLVHNELDYEAAGLAVSPTQHFWSLSVQGQIFLAVPFLSLLAVWTVRRLRPVPVRAVLGVLFTLGAVASFWYAVASVRANQALAYYDTGARTWELLAGALTAVALPLLSRAAVRVPGAVRGVVGYLALGMVGSCGLVLDGGRLFPGVATLWPVLAALALVVTGAAPTRFGPDRLLAGRLPRWLGAHAYGLYLWHWPVLILTLATTGGDSVGVAAGSAVLIASLALAMLTKRLVEDPLRRQRPAGGLPGRVTAPRRRVPSTFIASQC